jgi:Spy/CpxP family protein refolding chaperone
MARHQHGPQRQPGGPERSFIEILHKLDLSADQQEKIRSVLGNAHAQWRSESGRDLADLPALGNPGDPQHAAAVAAAKARAAERIALWSDAEQQVYTLLTPAQQARLPQLLTELQKEIAARHRDDPPGGPPPP